jgi:hypothetical protein
LLGGPGDQARPFVVVGRQPPKGDEFGTGPLDGASVHAEDLGHP